MSAGSKDTLPSLLMISSCVPVPDGSARRRQAWQLLQAAGRDHAVHLAALADGPVNLRDWRRLDNHAHRHLLLPPARGRGTQRALQEAIAPWQIERAFHLILCDAAPLWPLAARIPAQLHLDTRDAAAAIRTLSAAAEPPALHRRAA